MRNVLVLTVLVFSLFTIDNSTIFACAAGEKDCSTNYGVSQPSFSSGSSKYLASNSYSASGTAGDLTVGNISSKNFQAYTGFNTTDVPYIQLLTTAPNVCSGSLPVGTYYFKVTALDASNLESLPSTEQSVTLTSNQTCVFLAWSTLGDGYNFNVYFSTTSGSENSYFTTANNNYTLTSLTGGTSATPPVSSSSLARTPQITTINGINQIGTNGTLSFASVSTAISTFSVRCWVCAGYSVSYTGSPPTNGSYTMNPFSGSYTYYSGSQLSSTEFGINLAVNPTAGVGTAPTSPTLPSFGHVSAAYNIPDTFLYNSGDQIAYSQSSTSITTFTISYLFRVRTQTPAGKYNYNQTLVATGTY
jgi:hypothetical protein